MGACSVDGDPDEHVAGTCCGSKPMRCTCPRPALVAHGGLGLQPADSLLVVESDIGVVAVSQMYRPASSAVTTMTKMPAASGAVICLPSGAWRARQI